MKKNIPILQNFNLIKDFIFFVLSNQKKYILSAFLFFIFSLSIYFTFLIDKRYIYAANIHSNIQISEILELRNDISNKTVSQLDFDSYLSSTINRFFTTKQNLYNAIVNYDLLNFEELLSFETQNVSEILDLKNDKIKILKLIKLETIKINEPLDNILYDHKLSIESNYNLYADYLFSIIINSYIIYTIEALKNYIDLYEDSLQKNLLELKQKFVNAEKINDDMGNTEYIKFELNNEILSIQNSLQRLRNSSLVLLIRSDKGISSDSINTNIKGLANLFYTSEISSKVQYNYSLLSILIFISLFITFIIFIITYFNFLNHNFKKQNK